MPIYKKLSWFIVCLLSTGIISCSDGNGGDSDNKNGNATNPPVQPPGTEITAPSAIASVAAFAGDAQCILSWSIAEHATVYNVYWSTSVNVSDSDPYFVIEDKQYFHHANLANGGNYYYKIVAENVKGKSAMSALVSCTPSTVQYTDIVGAGMTIYAIDSNNNLWSWGDTQHGADALPTPVCESGDIPCSTYVSNVEKIASGGSHTLLLKSDGSVWAWGDNSFGHLGVEGGVYVNQPMPVCDNMDSSGCSHFLTNIVDIAAGYDFSLALGSDTFVYSWGINSYGDLGVATTSPKITPSRVCASGETDPCGAFLTNIVAISSGAYHSLAVDTSQKVWAWGINSSGELGSSTSDLCFSYECSTTPVLVDSLSNIARVHSGTYQSYAITNNGELWGWGSDNSSQLGIGTALNANITPKRVCAVGEPTYCTNYLGGITAIAGGSGHTLALNSSGNVIAWGINDYGNIGDGSTNTHLTAVAVTGLANVTKIAAGSFYSVALDASGKIYTWGWNFTGQLGVDRLYQSKRPRRVINLSNQIDIAASGSGVVVRTTNGLLQTWGGDMRLLLGYGREIFSSVPLSVTGLPAVQSISGIGSGFLALDNSGEVWTWSRQNYFGSKWGISHVCASGAVAPCSAFLSNVSKLPENGVGLTGMVIKDDGTLWAWGKSYLGDGTLNEGTTPQPVCAPGTLAPCQIYLGKVKSVALGAVHSVALLQDGTVWSWGDNSLGQLGSGDTVESLLPRPVCAVGESAPCAHYLTDVVDISAGEYFSSAVKANGSVVSWGLNSVGNLGNGTTTKSNVPVQVCAQNETYPCKNFLQGITAVASNYQHTLAIGSNGELWAWGGNSNGQLGDNSFIDRSVPVRVCEQQSDVLCINYFANVEKVSLGSQFSAALKTDGTVWIWGSNYAGQFGDGSLVMRTQPGAAF